MNNLKKIVLCAILIMSVFASSTAFAAENNLKTTPLQSFFSRFSKSKSESGVVKNKKDKSTNITLSKKNKKSKKDDVKESSIVFKQIMTITDCIGVALKNSPNINNAKATVRAQKSEIGIAKSAYFPSIFAGTGYNVRNTKRFGDLDNTTNGNYYGINAGITERIWDFGYTTARINMSKFNYQAAGYDLDNIILSTIYDTKIDYTYVLATRAKVDICKQSRNINQLNVDRTKAMYEVGLKSKIDLVNAQANLTNSQISLLDAEDEYEQALVALNNDMYFINAPSYSLQDTDTFNFQKNYSVKNEINVAYNRKNYEAGSVEAEIKDGAILTSGIEKSNVLKSYKFKPFGFSMQEAIDKAYDLRPDLKAMILAKMASEESLKAIKRSYMPVINANAKYDMNKFQDYGTHAVGIYAGVDIPTVNAMTVKNQIEQGKSYLDIAINNIDLLKKNIYFEIQSYYIIMKKFEKTIPLKAIQVQQTLENFELADGRYSVGLSNYLELQTAHLNYNSAQLDFVAAVFSYNQARFQLERAMGLKDSF